MQRFREPGEALEVGAVCSGKSKGGARVMWWWWWGGVTLLGQESQVWESCFGGGVELGAHGWGPRVRCMSQTQ